MRIFIFLIVCLFIYGCECNLRLTKSKLHSIHKFEYGFEVSKITVDSFTSDNIPIKFTVDTTITCSPNCYKYASESEFKAVKGDSAIYIDTCNFKSSKSIYLNKPNSDYEWWFFRPYQPSIDYDIFPLKFTKGNWYEISNACPYYYIYLYVEEDGEWLIKKTERY